MTDIDLFVELFRYCLNQRLLYSTVHHQSNLLSIMLSSSGEFAQSLSAQRAHGLTPCKLHEDVIHWLE